MSYERKMISKNPWKKVTILTYMKSRVLVGYQYKENVFEGKG